MIRERVKVTGIGHPKSMWVVYLLFGIVTLGIGVGLLLLQHYFSGVEVRPEHGMDDPSNLHLVAFPFLVIAAAFLFAVVNTVLMSGGQARITDGGQTVSCRYASGDGSQRIPPGVILAFLFHLPGVVQVGWGFFVGFASLFLMLEGPSALRDLWPSNGVRVEGQVVGGEALAEWQFKQQVYEYTFRYQLDGKARTSKSYTTGQRYNVGDSVEVVVDLDRPDSARITDTRRRRASWLVLAIPLGVLLLLPVGIVGNYIFNFQMLHLVRNGRIATATGDVQWESPTFTPGSTRRASSYTFLVDRQIYTVDRRSWVSGRAKTIAVLYSPHNPSCNVGLEGRRSAMLLRDASPWPLCLIGVLVPAACVAALIWLWTVL